VTLRLAEKAEGALEALPSASTMKKLALLLTQAA
jgi:hypothetical protein